jgi:hypothetical protein
LDVKMCTPVNILGINCSVLTCPRVYTNGVIRITT